MNRAARGLAWIGALVVMGTLAQVARAQEDLGTLEWPDAVAQAGEEMPAPAAQPQGRFTNLSDEPFRYRLRRCRGACWTEEFVIPPGESRIVLEGVDRADIQGLGKNITTPFIIVQYPQAPGYVRLKLTGRTGPDQSIFMPFYFYTKDVNGFGRLLQAPNEEAARRQEDQLLAEPKLDEAGRRELFAQAVASGVLHIPASDPPAWELPLIGPGGIRADAMIDGPVYYQGLPPGPVFINLWFYCYGYAYYLW